MARKVPSKYRFEIHSDETHENLFSFRCSRAMMLFILLSSIITLSAVVFSIIAFTPIKQIIPGYPSYKTQREAIDNALKVDSLQREMKLWSLQLTNIQRIISGADPLPIDSLIKNKMVQQVQEIAFPTTLSRQDSLLRDEINSKERFNISSNVNKRVEQIEGMLFFPPVKGVITEEYNVGIGHPYIDIVVPNNTIVYATLDGTIISSTWTDESGYTIQIQHSNDLISVYKHNIKMLLRAGDRVKAGSPISIVGNAGSLSTGTHLHFELWHKGEAIDPALYINF